jgi:hypothetical protein
MTDREDGAAAAALPPWWRRGWQALQQKFRQLLDWAARHTLRLAFALLALAVGSQLLPRARVPVQEEALPAGDLTLQFIGTRSNARALQRVLQGHEALRDQVMAALYWDFALIAFYVLVLGWLLRLLRDSGFGGPAPRLAHRFAPWTPWLAGLFDLLENLGILGVLHGGADGIGMLAGMTTLAATLKWTCLLYALGCLAAGAARLLRRAAPPPPAAVAGAAAGGDAASLLRVERLADEYDQLRDTLPSGPDRTRLMSGVMAEMASQAGAVAPHLPRLTESPRAGERLAAVAALQSIVAPHYLPWLVTRLVQERPFVAFHAAVALLALLPRLTPQQRESVKQGVQAAQKELADKGLRDAERDAVMARILQA